MNKEHQRLYALTDLILGRMQKNNGPVSFHDWMQSALYEPELGYYESEKIFGKDGDFTTGTAMGNWLAMAFADTIYKAWESLGSPAKWTLIEQGSGSGQLLSDIIKTLKEKHLNPDCIYSVEISAQLRDRQSELYQANSLQVHQVNSFHDIPKQRCAIMFSNELPDAFPVTSFIWENNSMLERGVDWDGKKFVWTELSSMSESEKLISEQVREQWPEGYISEFNPHLSSWQQDISEAIEQGIIITVDYGYTQHEYYRPHRLEGTLMGHYLHQVVDDVLKLSPGVCDITAHVDFTALKQAGEQAGLEAITYTSQGAWIAQSESVQHHIAKLAANPDADSVSQITHAKRLMLPTGMGESFKILIQGKGIEDTAPLSLPAFDRLSSL